MRKGYHTTFSVEANLKRIRELNVRIFYSKISIFKEIKAMRFFYFLSIFFVCHFVYVSGQTYSCQHGKQLATSTPSLYYSYENLRSDTFDVLKYTIRLEIGNSISKLINGNTTIRFVPKKINPAKIRFDLLKLVIDSVKFGNNNATYTYNDTVASVSLPPNLTLTDTSTVTIYYRGQPKGDASGWGGFYFDNTGGGDYAYNLGVGFAAKPHNYGRVWFPCFDNFVERSKYEFVITSDSARRAYCNGQLTTDVLNGAKRTRTWIMNEEIPTYLASVAVAKYKQVNWSTPTLTGNKAITLAAVAGDTTALKNGFVNLKNCITGFENYFGPYKWNRFGYVLVPFNSGAMEHATNIAYPRAVAGSMQYEASLMAHELSHHWWGDLITCETQEDMWINEGMASYSAFLFQEWQYGKQRYLDGLKRQHDNLLQFLHKKEGGFRAVSGIPHNLTYGDHVYLKGSDIAHTLRGYMTDNAFFNACKYVMQQKERKSINALEFRDLLQTSSGQNLSAFFDNWILNGGWPNFAIDSTRSIPQTSGFYNVVVHVRQRKFGAPQLFTGVPLEVSFFDANRVQHIRNLVMSGAKNSYTFTLPFSPGYTALNYDSKIFDAVSSEVRTIKTVATIGFTLAKATLLVSNKGQDSSLVRIEHHYVAPDGFKNNPYNAVLSDQHYWKVDGILTPGFASRLRFSYDGNKTTSNTNSYMDTLITKTGGDSVVVFYRKNTADDWKLVKYFSKFTSGPKTGIITLDSIKLGEYTFGKFTDSLQFQIGIKEISKADVNWQVFPNPAKQEVQVDLSLLPEQNYWIEAYQNDKLVYSGIARNALLKIETNNWSRGTYIIRVRLGRLSLSAKKVVLE
jgi:hypothetical protein